MKKLATAVVVGLFSMGAASGVQAADAAVKIGYVDLQKAVQSTEAGKKAKKELEKEFNERKKKIEGKEKDLKAMKEDLEKKAMVMSEDVRQKKQQEFQENMMQYQSLVGKSQQEIQQRERSLTQPILEKLRKVLDKMASQKEFSMVLEKSEQSILWAKKDLDLTDDLIKAFEKEK